MRDISADSCSIFYSIAHGLHDFTIPVVSRHWACSSNPKVDMIYTSELLDELCYGPQDSAVRAYVDRHPHATSEAFVADYH